MHINKVGNVIDALHFLITTGNPEKNDPTVDYENLWSSSDNGFRVSKKIPKLPWPVWNRAFLQAMKIVRTDDEFIMTTVSCDHLLNLPLPSRTLNAFMKGQYRVERTGKQKYVFKWISQADPKGNIPAVCVSWASGLLRDAMCNVYYSVMSANLLQPKLKDFKQNLINHGIGYYKREELKSKELCDEDQKY